MCKKCNERKAMCFMSDMWVCGQCIHEFVQKQNKQRQKVFLEG